jgi:hypothetical protein
MGSVLAKSSKITCKPQLQETKEEKCKNLSAFLEERHDQFQILPLIFQNLITLSEIIKKIKKFEYLFESSAEIFFLARQKSDYYATVQKLAELMEKISPKENEEISRILSVNSL